MIGAAGVLTALVPGSMILMTAATLLANNLYRAVHRSASDAHVLNVAKLLVPVVALVAIYFTLAGGQTIVALLLMGYSFVTQLFPALVLSLARNRGSRARAQLQVSSPGWPRSPPSASHHATIGTLFPALPVEIKELNTGLIALAVNVMVLAVVGARREARTTRSSSLEKRTVR